MSKRILYSQQNVAGLVNANAYIIMPDGTLLNVGGGPPINVSWSSLYALGLRVGNGIYTPPTDIYGHPDSLGLQVNLNTGGQVFTGIAGGTVTMLALMTPPDVPVAAGVGPALADKAGFSRANLATLQAGLQTQVTVPFGISVANATTDTQLANWSCPAYFLFYITATTWPSAGALFQMEARWI